METICQVPFNLMSGEEARKAEPILRDYLLRSADQVSMTRIGSSSISLFNLIPHPFRVRNFLNRLDPVDIAEKTDQVWTFNLTDKIKNFLNQETLLVTGSGKFFYGFTDPKFTLRGNEIAYLVTNEKLLTLYISDTDKETLSQQGIYLDSPET